MPFGKLHPYRYALYRKGRRVDTVTFYARNQRQADRFALAWCPTGREIMRVKRRARG